jgi:hypothetical protein
VISSGSQPHRVRAEQVGLDADQVSPAERTEQRFDARLLLDEDGQRQR